MLIDSLLFIITSSDFSSETISGSLFSDFSDNSIGKSNGISNGILKSSFVCVFELLEISVIDSSGFTIVSFIKESIVSSDLFTGVSIEGISGISTTGSSGIIFDCSSSFNYKNYLITLIKF